MVPGFPIRWQHSPGCVIALFFRQTEPEFILCRFPICWLCCFPNLCMHSVQPIYNTLLSHFECEWAAETHCTLGRTPSGAMAIRDKWCINWTENLHSNKWLLLALVCAVMEFKQCTFFEHFSDGRTNHPLNGEDAIQLLDRLIFSGKISNYVGSEHQLGSE